jgi:uncharacterized glyoxalase superfamily protein PhnB
MTAVQPIPSEFHTLTPHLVVYDANAAIDFYKRAFGAEELTRMPGPDGKSIIHASVRIGDSILMMSEECREYGGFAPTALGGSPVTIHLYVENVDAVVERAVLNGAKLEMPVTDMFWGDRYGKVTDPFGHHWSVATHIKNVTPAEMKEAMKQQFCGAAAQ